MVSALGTLRTINYLKKMRGGSGSGHFMFVFVDFILSHFASPHRLLLLLQPFKLLFLSAVTVTVVVDVVKVSHFIYFIVYFPSSFSKTLAHTRPNQTNEMEYKNEKSVPSLIRSFHFILIFSVSFCESLLKLFSIILITSIYKFCVKL